MAAISKAKLLFYTFCLENLIILSWKFQKLYDWYFLLLDIPILKLLSDSSKKQTITRIHQVRLFYKNLFWIFVVQRWICNAAEILFWLILFLSEEIFWTMLFPSN